MKQPLRSSSGAQIMMEIAKGCWEMRLHVLTGSSCSRIDAVMAEIGRKSSPNSKISISIRIFAHKRVLQIAAIAVIIIIVHTLIFLASDSAPGSCCVHPRGWGSSSANLPKK